ncbi:thiamine pyrophosphate-dependent enzyme [Streptomyces sp. NBC_00306]|uniref:thiamine pyrophosphate-dependent enzyme n=1 Tax=Streptomyces sp. NBC_00306 TaxID=2975708 RepID=UPI002E28F301|nr:thiamine pyrophosphate-dependent enzyme [Streptomyces sp. NBC_00306]
MSAMPLTGGETAVRALALHGTVRAFGIPGTHNLEIYRHLAAYGIDHVTPRHEQGAGYAADGYARVTGRPGVAITTTGPALLNIAAAVGQAYSDSVPLLVVSPGMPLRHPRQATGLLHEMRSQTEALRGVAAFSHRVSSVDEIGTAVARAFTLFTTERPRPVHIEIPLDLLESAESVAPLRLSPPVRPAAPRSEQLARAGEALRTASRPALVLGGGARGAASELCSLVEELAAPVVTTANGKGIVDESHPLSLGVSLHSPAVQKWLADCDVVLAVGTELAESDLWSEPVPLGGTLVRVDLDPAQMYAGIPAHIPLVGDAREIVSALLGACREGRSGSSAAPSLRLATGGGTAAGAHRAVELRLVRGDESGPHTGAAEGAEAVEDRRGPGLRAADARPVAAGPGAVIDTSGPQAGADVVADRGSGMAGADHEPRDATADHLMGVAAGADHEPEDATVDHRLGVAQHRTGVAAVAELRVARDGETRERDARWLPYLHAIRSVLDADAVITSDSAQCCYYGALPHLPIGPDARYLHPTGFGTLGYALPAAIGAKSAHPDRQVLALSGDGGLQFSIQELATAAQLRLPLPVVVFDNGGYGEIRDEMAARGDTPAAVDLAPVDLPGIARAYGGHGTSATTPEALAAALTRAFATPGPTVITVPEETSR